MNPFSLFLSRGDFVSIGREEVLEEIARVITQVPPDDRDLHSLPQMGKTTLLRYIASQEFIKNYRDKFIKPFDRQPERLFFVNVSGWNAGTHPYIVLYHEYYRQYQLYQRQHPELAHLSLAEPAARDAGHALNLLEPHLWALHQNGFRPVILFDDFASELAFGVLDLDETTRLGLWKDFCALIFATEQLLEDVNPKAKGSPLFKRLTQTQIRAMLPEEADAFLRAVLEEHGGALPKEDIDEVVSVAGGFPYLIMLGGRVVWDLRRELGLLEEAGTPLPDGVMSDLSSRLYDVFHRTFDLYYRSLSAARRDVLLDLAQRGTLEGAAMQQISKQTQHVGWLTKYGLVSMKPNGDRVLFSPLFRKFLNTLAESSPPAETEPELPPLQAELYDTFRRHPNKDLSYGDLGQAVWALRPDNLEDAEKRKIHLAIHKLRAELKRAGRGDRIVNVRKRGYRYEPAS